LSLPDALPISDADPAPGAPVEHLTLDASKEAFAGGIVRGTSFPGHGTDQSRCFYPLEPARPAVMSASVRVQHRPLAGTEGGQCVVQHGVDHLRVRAGADAPGYHHAVKAIDVKAGTKWALPQFRCSFEA